MEDSTKNIQFSSKNYSKATVNNVVDKSFKEFGKTSVEDNKTVDKFFQDYEDLFYQIPATGSTNSHEYLVNMSSKMYKQSEDLANIQALIDEINTLRSQVLQYQTTIINLQTQE